jgi:hypothetical protein
LSGLSPELLGEREGSFDLAVAGSGAWPVVADSYFVISYANYVDIRQINE